MLHTVVPVDIAGDEQNDAQRRALVQAAQAGSPEAWNELYAHVYRRLRAYVVRRCGRDVAEDVVGETMTRAVGAIRRFRWESSGFDAWLFGIAHHVTADHHRRLERASRLSPRFDPSYSPYEAPGERAELADDHAQVRRAFASLPEKDRELLELRVIAGLSADEVAAVLGRHSGSVRMAQSRALARLRSMLEEAS